MLFFVFVAALKAKKKADRKKKKKLKTRQANAEGAGGGGGGGAEREVQASSSSATVLSSLSLFPIPASPRSQLDYLQEANTRDKKLIEVGVPENLGVRFPVLVFVVYHSFHHRLSDDVAPR